MFMSNEPITSITLHTYLITPTFRHNKIKGVFMIKHIAEHEFPMYVLESSKNLVIVDFWAPWCKPCQAMEPTWDSISRRFTTQIDIVKVNVDDEPRIAQGAHVSSIPTIVYFKKGKIVRRDVGVKSEQDLTGIITELLMQQ